MMRKLVIIFFLISGFAHGQDTMLRLQDCYDNMLVNYPVANQTGVYSQMSELNIKNLKTGWLPNTEFNAQATYQSEAIKVDISAMGNNFGFEADKDQYKATVDINQLIYDWGRIKSAKKVENADLKVNQQKVQVELNKVKELINQFFFSILILEKNEELLNVVLEELKSKEKSVSAGVENGILLKSDLSALKAEKLKVNQSITEIGLQRMAAINALSEITGTQIKPDVVLEVPEYNLEMTTQLNRPEWELFDCQKEMLEFNSQVISKQNKPKIFAFSQLGYGKPGLNMINDEFDSYYFVGVGLKWNFWDWNKTKRQKQIISLNKNIITSQQNTFNKQINVALKNEKTKIDIYSEAIKSDKEIIKLREEVTESARSKLDNGVITSSDYISELTRETQAKLKYETHKLKLVKSKVNYLYIKGEI